MTVDPGTLDAAAGERVLERFVDFAGLKPWPAGAPDLDSP